MTESDSIISNRSLSELLQDSLTSTPCVNIRKNAKVRVATGMLVQYLERFTDSVVVRDDTKPIGVIGGREIIQGVFKNPSSDFFEMKQVDEIVDKHLNVVTPDTTLKELISLWKEAGRAFAVVDMGNDDYSVISVKKLLEIGIKNTFEFHLSEIPKKKIITFDKDATFGNVMKLMLENRTRKILLEGTNQFINDRIIIEAIEKFDYLLGNDHFLDIPASVVSLEDAKVVADDLSLSEISKIMYEMSQPLIIHEERAISPWDICMSLEKR
ncbi:MAG: CBS domain-containing protein [Nitrosopumilus sp.]|nr:CBS domain-containing protein [Nitrosopumilus sp.]MDH3488052.1 CBS domain-containing protein [Nitrosopumilus sp.]